MARYKHIDTSPRFLAVDPQRQLIPGTIEHALNHPLDHEIDLSHFYAGFSNDITGATAYGNGSDCAINGYTAVKFRGAQRDRVPCTHRDKCLRTPDKTKVRQVAFLQSKAGQESYTDKMKRKIDSSGGRIPYGRRFATVEPVSSNLRHNKQLNRFTLRGRKKVDAQWKLYRMAHNIEKLAHHGYTDQSQDYYEERYRERVLRQLAQHAEKMGMKLVVNEQPV